jgi:hypothetical protein
MINLSKKEINQIAINESEINSGDWTKGFNYALELIKKSTTNLDSEIANSTYILQNAR